MLSRVRTLARSVSAFFSRFGSTPALSSRSACFIGRLAYQTWRLRIAAKPVIAFRYERAVASTAASRSFREKPLSRPAIAKLAARRFTSHSHGPGAVSSKSLMSKTRVRSGEPNVPKFERCASPHSWVRMLEFGVRERSVAMISAPPR